MMNPKQFKSHLFAFFVLIFCLTNSTFAQLSDQEIDLELTKLSDELRIDQRDFAEYVITDNYTSKGIDHIYMKQSFEGVAMWESYFAIHGKTGYRTLDPSYVFRNLKPVQFKNRSRLSAIEAIRMVCSQKDYQTPVGIVLEKEVLESKNQLQYYRIDNVSAEIIPVNQVYYQSAKGTYSLAWEMDIDDINSDDYMKFIVDASTGKIIYEYNYTVSCDPISLKKEEKHDHCKTDKHTEHESSKALEIPVDNSYNIFRWPIEAPHNGGRTIEITPWLDNTNASPNGWHAIGETSFTTTRGNNVDAYEDRNDSNSPTNGDAARAQGGINLDFNFPLDTALNPINYKNAAVTNLFYWNNVIHDVWYNYGFDEASGNFQEENFGRGGASSDYVRAEAMDGSGTCNANFGTPPDGSNPRMQMYLCDGRDGDYDNGVIVHEYGHGISNRLTGGPSNSSCLGNVEQMGEGWSDYFGMVMTIEPGDAATDARGMGTWLFGEGPSGGGIRPYPYCTDMNINPFTYDAIKGNISNPHGIGSVWATMLWDMTWALIDEYGWDADIYNGTGGNNIAMQLVIEGLKLQPCNPGFVDGRNAILLADEMLYNGDNKCLIWQAFANRGLGFSASQGSSNDRYDGVEAFDIPSYCFMEFDKYVDKTDADPGEELNYSFDLLNISVGPLVNINLRDTLHEGLVFVEASDGGSYNPTTRVVAWPPVTIGVGQSISYSIVVEVDAGLDGYVEDFGDDLESGTSNWSASNTGNSQWIVSSNEFNSTSHSWFAADVSTPSIAQLNLANPVGITNSSELNFWHYYDTEATWDGGLVYISTDNGISWTDLGPYFSNNGYNSIIYDAFPGFSGNSGGFINSVVDLSSFAGQMAIIRFEMNCDQAVGGLGWYIDDIQLTNLAEYIPNTMIAQNSEITARAQVEFPTLVNYDPSLLKITVDATPVTCFGNNDGIANVVAESGTGNYTYLWSNGENTATIQNLVAGEYTVTVNDGVTTRTKSVLVESLSNMVLAMSGSNANNGNDGTATVTVSNGNSPYSYLWNTGSTNPSIDNLVPGIYTVTVTDNLQCSKVNSVEIYDPANCPVNSVEVSITFDQYPEDITLIIRTSSNVIIFQENYSGEPNASTITENFCLVDDCYEIEIFDSYGDGLCGNNSNPFGSYEIVDLNTNETLYDGCFTGSGITRNLCYPLLSASFIEKAPSCIGLSDGSIEAIASGGNGGYNYSFSNGSTNYTAVNLAAGQYSVTITDDVSEIEGIFELKESLATVYKEDNDGIGSLRYAIDEACATDTVRFETNLMNKTIVLDSPINVDNDRVIIGLGTNLLKISGNNASPLFNVLNSGTVSLSQLTLQDGSATSNGGAFHVIGSVILEDVLLDNNKENSQAKAWSGPGNVLIKGNVQIQN